MFIIWWQGSPRNFFRKNLFLGLGLKSDQRVSPSVLAVFQTLQSNNFLYNSHTNTNKISFCSLDITLFNAAKMKQIRRRRIELLMCEVENSATNDKNAKNCDSSAVQSSIIKQHAIELFKHTHIPSYMIDIKVRHIITFNERNSTPQK